MGIREAILHEMKEIGLAEGRIAGREEGLEEGRQKGLEEGLEEGRQKGLEEGFEEKEQIVVRKAWEKGFPLEDIAFLTDISLEKAQAIIQSFTNVPNEEEE